MTQFAPAGLEGSAATASSSTEVVALRRLSERQRRAAVRAHDLVSLFSARPDLVGVHAPADLAADAVRWCA